MKKERVSSRFAQIQLTRRRLRIHGQVARSAANASDRRTAKQTCEKLSVQLIDALHDFADHGHEDTVMRLLQNHDKIDRDGPAT